MVSFLEILSYVHIKYFCLTLSCPQPPLSSPLTFFFDVTVNIFILRSATFSFVSTVYTCVSLCGPVNLYEWLWMPSSLQGCYLFRKPTGGLCHDRVRLKSLLVLGKVKCLLLVVLGKGNIFFPFENLICL